MDEERLIATMSRLVDAVGYLGEQIEGLRDDLHETRSEISKSTQKGEEVRDELVEVVYALDELVETLKKH